MRQTIFIASPLEPEHVARIQAVDPARLEVLTAPDLLPTPGYAGEHANANAARVGPLLERWRDLLGRADILWDLPSAEDLPFARKLRWVQTTSTGVGPAVAQRGLQHGNVLVTTARGVHARPLAEFVMMALLLHFRGLRHLDTEQRAHRWTRFCGQGIAGRTLVLIGAGDLARGTARVARALDMHVVAVARDAERVRAHNDMFHEIVPVELLHRALGMADAVVVTLPHTPRTERLIDGAAFAAFKPGAAFVNIGRGIVIDEPALIENLRSGHVSFAALDVTDIEPLAAESPLWDMPNVLISPHSASTVTGENAAITDIFIHNLRCWLDGRQADMRNVLDKQLLY